MFCTFSHCAHQLSFIPRCRGQAVAGGGRRRSRLRGAMQTLPRTRCQPRGPESRLRTRSSAALGDRFASPGVAACKRGAADGPDRWEGGARGGGRSHTWHSGFASHDPAPDVSALLPTLASPRPKVAVEALQRGQPGPLRGKKERERERASAIWSCMRRPTLMSGVRRLVFQLHPLKEAGSSGSKVS